MSLEKHLKTYVVTTDGNVGAIPGTKQNDVPVSVEDILINPVNREEEKELYQNLYNRIYPNVQMDTDYGHLAKISNLNRRKLRQALLFRLGSGEVMQLFGLIKGKCFVCEHRLAFDNTMEPFCLKCLQTIDRYFQNHGNKSSGSSRCNNNDVEGKTDELDLPILEPQVVQPAMRCDAEILDEIDLLFEDDDLEIDLETQQKQYEIDELLALNNADISGIEDFESRFGIDVELQQLIENNSDEPMRHYGFKRVRSKDQINP